ncbi:hypothetical protein BE20_16565 [Sorangium cellulosum]|uniref:CHAT domain-containing protein n=1 Tax=Sorangium cellulosum TaxID=56 RepID=A0A150T224_SORCE|nr:hypothetical protein BE20_16565 [Sorangium cellulosum]KYF98673.1 hypothetical protein BE18_04550 [Sorangium cellulosum]
MGGQRAFQALFERADAGGMFAAASAGGYHELLLQIWSDDPKVLAWPWEALRDLQGRALSPACQLERRLNRAQDPPPVPAELPRDRVNILLVIARPYEADVQFRSIARPLVELIEKQGLPARVHVLRPPTLDRLREHLRERPNHYHLVHFDGHGSYGPGEAPTGPHAYGAPEGRLIFEDDQGKAAPVTAEVLSNLLQEHHVPAMVLNACQSAMLDEQAGDPFASVATALINAGTRSVVAMSYSLYVSGAEQFLPAFYRRLFETGTFVEAARAGRQQMFAARGRVCARGRFDLEDWLVPVVYQQDAEALSFAAAAQPPVSARERLPGEALDGQNPYGFIGRDGALLELERALRRPAPAIVIRSAEYVFNQLGGPVLGDAFLALRDVEEKIEALVRFYKKHRFLLVWDNFEVVAGSPGFPATMSEGDRQHLRSFLQRLRGAPTKVLITSRSEEAWLGTEQRRKAVCSKRRRITSSGSSRRNAGISRRPSTGISRRSILRRSTATSTMRRAPTTSSGSSRRSAGTFRRPSAGISRRSSPRRSTATNAVQRVPITSSGRSHRSAGTFRRPSAGVSSRWRSLRTMTTSTARQSPITSSGSSQVSRAAFRMPVDG